MKTVLVIVVTYNGMRWLDRSLGSVYADADLYVFDNDSADGSADYVEAHYPQAKLVRSADNLGFSKPNNLGFSYAIEKGYEYVYLLNQDAWLEVGALEKLVAASRSNPGFGVLSPMQMTAGFQDLDYQFSKIVSGISEGRSGNGTGLLEVKRVMAAHWLIPVSVIKRIGPFEEDLFPHWGQDDEWCNRLHFFGLKIGVVPGARAVHDRAWREEPLEKLARRNYYMGSLVCLCDCNKSVFGAFLFTVLFTFVKAFKYRSLLPFKYFRQIIRDLPRVKELRASVRARV